MSATPTFVEVMSGRMRPRHRRFHSAFQNLCGEIGRSCDLRSMQRPQRLLMQAVTRWSGVRTVSMDESGALGVLHQSLNRGSMPYLAEFDVPLGIHGYSIPLHRRAAAEARRLMERPQFRALLVFSDWAGRSFDLHFGPQVGAKCRTVYPLAYEGAYCGDAVRRPYDFSFISTEFRIKSGPELVRAFCAARRELKSDARLCVVTGLGGARKLMGSLEHYEGVEWREAKLGESEIADLLAQTRCLLHPSLSDSFGVVVLEALAAGCALIVSDIASFPEMASAGNGWIVQVPTAAVVGDTYITEFGAVDYHERYLNTLSMHRLEDALEERIRIFLTDTELARSMMRASQDLYARRFSLPAWKTRMLGVIAEGFPELKLAEQLL